MRIAHVTATFPPYYAGTGIVCYHNALELARRGHDVTVFTAAHPPGEYTYPSEITVRRLPVLFRVGNAPVLPGLLGLHGFDLIHLHIPFVCGAEVVSIVSSLRHIPFVITHHNDMLGDGLRRHLLGLYWAVSTQCIIPGARKILAVSLDHAWASHLAPIYRRRPADVVEVPNGVDVNLFNPAVDGRWVREKHGISEEAKLALFVGVLDRAHHFKGVGHLLHALARQNNQDLILMLVGDGDQKAHWVELADTLGLSARTRFVGMIPNDHLPPYYAATDAVILPSLPPESFGMVLIEAMACGKPVIASNLPGVRTVVSDSEDGLLVTPGDVTDLAEKIHMLLDSPQRRTTMGERGRMKVEEKYAWPKVVEQLERVYEEALAVQSHPQASASVTGR